MLKRTCPESGREVCCSDECRALRHRRIDRESRRRARWASESCEVYMERGQRLTLAAEHEEKARRRAAFFAARDAAFERAGLPIPKIEIRNGILIESRGTIAWGGRTANPSISLSVNL